MPTTTIPHHLPDYDTFLDSIAVLALPLSASELHGTMCGYLSAGATEEGETYLHSLTLQKKDPAMRAATLSLFRVYAICQQQLTQLGFDFQLLLPDENEPLTQRAQAFSEWCDGFIQSITRIGIDYNQIEDDDTQDAIQHLSEFAELDYESLRVDTEDEEAFMEVCEYARMAVLHVHCDLHMKTIEKKSAKITH